MKNVKESETVSSVYADVIPVNRSPVDTVPPGSTIYADVEMNQRPTPSDNTIYASIQSSTTSGPTGGTVKAMNPVYQEAIEVKDGAECDAAGYPVYAEPMKLKKCH